MLRLALQHSQRWLFFSGEEMASAWVGQETSEEIPDLESPRQMLRDGSTEHFQDWLPQGNPKLFGGGEAGFILPAVGEMISFIGWVCLPINSLSAALLPFKPGMKLQGKHERCRDSMGKGI